MTSTNQHVAPMSHANISHSDRCDAVRSSLQQLALNTTGDIDVDFGSNSSTSFYTNTQHILYDNGGGELEEGEILEDVSSVGDDQFAQADFPYRKDNSEALSTPLGHLILPPVRYPIREVEFYYYEHNRRLTSTYAARLNHLLRTPAGMRVFSLYNTWLNSSGWDLHNFSVPPPGPELEILSLAMAVEIDNRWAARKESQDMEVWGNGQAGECVIMEGRVERMGSLPPMSPKVHPFHPFWLPDTE